MRQVFFAAIHRAKHWIETTNIHPCTFNIHDNFHKPVWWDRVNRTPRQYTALISLNGRTVFVTATFKHAYEHIIFHFFFSSHYSNSFSISYTVVSLSSSLYNCMSFQFISPLFNIAKIHWIWACTNVEHALGLKWSMFLNSAGRQCDIYLYVKLLDAMIYARNNERKAYTQMAANISLHRHRIAVHFQTSSAAETLHIFSFLQHKKVYSRIASRSTCYPFSCMQKCVFEPKESQMV